VGSALVHRFGILGPIEVWSDGGRLDLGGPRQLRLFALLLVNANRAVPNDQLIEALWGPESSPGAAKRLQVAIVRLRKALGEQSVQTIGGGYRLVVEPRDLDADAFNERVKHGRHALDRGEAPVASEFLRSALSMWRGPALAEVAYEPFAQAEIRRLDELRLNALEERIEADLQLGRHFDLVGELDALVAEHPTRERFPRQLMLALYRSGRQADALEIFQRARAGLAERLGLEPGPALQSMQAQVLAHDPALDLPREPVTAKEWKVVAEPPAPAPPSRAFLVVRAGHSGQRIIRLDGARQLTLGREPNTDVPLTGDPKISRVHALLERVGDDWSISDDGLSRNGTYCNGKRIHRLQRLEDGDLLRIGATTIIFRNPVQTTHNTTAASTGSHRAVRR
jgi:DNA-binding SARP family transcriptional activator